MPTLPFSEHSVFKERTPFTEHPQRKRLNDELHSRPAAAVDGNLLCSHLAFITGENGFDTEKTSLRGLAAHFGVAAPDHIGNHITLDLGPMKLVWERHTEFSTYTFSHALDETISPEDAFSYPPTHHLPPQWRSQLEGELLVAINLVLLKAAPDDLEPTLPSVFGDNTIIGSVVSGGKATTWTDFQIHTDRASRMLVANDSLTPGRTGRLVQRLLEIETYRMMSLLAFPLARTITPQISEMETQLAEIASQTALTSGLEDEQKQLNALTQLAAKVEMLNARTDFRFSAAHAYHELVERRLNELDEQKLPGMQQISTFLNRRLSPAMRTTQSVERRLDTLSEHIARASALLRTRVEVSLQENNQQLLSSMESGVHMQIRLQETVEGVSVVAISYYLLGLLNYALKAVAKMGVPLDPGLVTGIAAPFVIGAIFLSGRALRRHLKHKSPTQKD
ncbi:MAG: DUF3422 domain-containing protein [Parvibaculaceae bacterium]|nr:DUF3422 domain-containing protein [Parvibaculaceae bacterium]